MRGVERRPGAALLEAVAALAILSTVAVAMLSLARESAVALEHVRTTERQMLRASVFLDAVALWPAPVLDRHLGERLQGHWRLNVEKNGAVYRVLLSDTLTSRALLRTALHRHTPSGLPHAE